MRRIILLAVCIFMMVCVCFGYKAESPTIRRVDNVQVGSYQLHVLCDAPRGNIVYVTESAPGFALEAVAVTVLHQPDICK